MKLAHVNILRGPNIWSIRRTNLIEMLLDLEELEELPTNKIPGFYERITALLPSLYSHRCSEGVEGGFFTRVKLGTWLGHVIEHIALELQTMADMPTGFGRTRSTDKKGVYHVVFSYVDEEAGKFAGRAAIDIAQALIDGTDFDIGETLMQLRNIWTKNKLGPSTGAIAREAASRGIPVLRLDDNSYLQFGYGKNQKRIDASIASTTSNIGVDIAGCKHRTKQVLTEARIPVPQGTLVRTHEELRAAVSDIGLPVVIKPAGGNHGNGAGINLNNWHAVFEAFEAARRYDENVVVEKYIEGCDFRVLVVNFKFIAAAKRIPACVVGNGISTIQQLIDHVNADPRRGDGHDNSLTKIVIDRDTTDILAKNKLSLDSVLPLGQHLPLKSTANLSTGGTSIDCTDNVHPMNRLMFERIARVINLDICGIDVMARDLTTPLRESGGAVIEVNAAPGLRMHLEPSEGTPRNVAKPIVDMLFPEYRNPRIPIIAITGTNGKTTTTRLIASIMKNAGFNTGFTTTDGIYIGDELIETGDCSGPASARKVLMDPSVNCAVLECARGGLLRSGLAFDRCDVGVITNIAEDHLGLNSINTIQQLARVKAVVAETVSDDGTAVLNADDDLVYAIAEDLDCNIALFSTNTNNPRIKEHQKKGGLTAVYDNGFIVAGYGFKRIIIEKASRCPITYEGKAEFNIANILAAVLASLARAVPVSMIRQTITEFQPSTENTPGRINLFDFGSKRVILDYAHNPHGLRALGNFVTKLDCRRLIGMITGVGDRRDQDIMAIGEEAARIFDSIIIRHDADLRGRTVEQMNALLLSGIRKADQNMQVMISSEESEAIEIALGQTADDDILVLLVDDTKQCIKLLKKKLDEFRSMHVEKQII
jgi:cyanophycin synthetase